MYSRVCLIQTGDYANVQQYILVTPPVVQRFRCGYGIHIYLCICWSKDMPYILLPHFAAPLHNQCAALYHLQSPLAFSALHYLPVSNPLPPDGLIQQLLTPQNYAPPQYADRHPAHSDTAGFHKLQEQLTCSIDFTRSDCLL
jgi:hypothetical protein